MGIGSALLRFGLGLLAVSFTGATAWYVVSSYERPVSSTYFSLAVAALSTWIASNVVLRGRLETHPQALKGVWYFGTLSARASMLVRGLGSFLFGCSSLIGAANLGGIQVSPEGFGWGVLIVLVLSVLEAGFFKQTRCPDSGLKGRIWSFRACDGSLASCSGREVHASTLDGLDCMFCQEEMRVRHTSAQPRNLAPGRKCERRYTRGSSENPVEFCFCEKHTFARSEFYEGYCPEKGCEFSKARSEQRRAIRMGGSWDPTQEVKTG